MSNPYKIPIQWPMKPVYPPFSVDGVKVALMPDGTIYAAIPGEEDQPEYQGRLGDLDTGKPWIPQHKNFNYIVRDKDKDGDFNQIRGRYRHRRNRQKAVKRAAPELYEGLLIAKKRLKNHGLYDDEIRAKIQPAIDKANETPRFQE